MRTKINEARTGARFMAASDGFNYSTTRLINKYLAGKKQARPARRPSFSARGRALAAGAWRSLRRLLAGVLRV